MVDSIANIFPVFANFCDLKKKQVTRIYQIIMCKFIAQYCISVSVRITVFPRIQAWPRMAGGKMRICGRADLRILNV